MEKPKILIVDDEFSFAEFAQLLLNQIGCETSICLESVRAVSKALLEKPDLMLVDLQMPYLDGRGVIKQLKENPKTRHIPVVLCTLSQDRSKISEAFTGGAVYYMAKPLRKEPLKIQIESILNKKLN